MPSATLVPSVYRRMSPRDASGHIPLFSYLPARAYMYTDQMITSALDSPIVFEIIGTAATPASKNYGMPLRDFHVA